MGKALLWECSKYPKVPQIVTASLAETILYFTKVVGDSIWKEAFIRIDTVLYINIF